MKKTVTLWRPVKHWEDLYEISNKGSIRRRPLSSQDHKNVVYHFPERIIRGHVNENGTVSVRLSDGGTTQQHQVHKLLTEAFPSISEWDALEIAEYRYDTAVKMIQRDFRFSGIAAKVK